MKHSIVILDDHEAISKAVSMTLIKYGYSVKTCKSPSDLIKRLKTEKFDLLVLDYEMGEKTALDVIPEVHKLAANLPIVIYTMHNEPWVVSLLVKYAVKGIIDKNDELSEVCKAADKILTSGEKYYSPTMLDTLLGILGDKTVKRKLQYTPSPREKEIINLLSYGFTSNEISEKLFLSKSTVDTIRKNILLKSDALNVSHLMRMAFLKGWIDS